MLDISSMAMLMLMVINMKRDMKINQSIQIWETKSSIIICKSMIIILIRTRKKLYPMIISMKNMILIMGIMFITLELITIMIMNIVMKTVNFCFKQKTFLRTKKKLTILFILVSGMRIIGLPTI